MTPFRRMVAAGTCIAAGLSIGACSASVHASVNVGGTAGTATLNNPNKLVSEGLQKVTGTAPAGVSCPAHVPAAVGHVFKCNVTINSAGDYVIATVTEKSIKGTTVNVHISDSKKIYKP